MNSVSCVISARMSSSRLPGKVLLPLHNDMSMLDIISEKVKRLCFVSDIILSTTSNAADTCLVEWAERNNLVVDRGPESDVLLRVHNSSQLASSDNILYLLGDSPLVSPNMITSLYEAHYHASAAYSSLYSVELARKVHGLDKPLPAGTRVQIINKELLYMAVNLTKDKPHFREHASEFFVQNIHLLSSKIVTRSELNVQNSYPCLAKFEKLNIPFAVNTMNDYESLKQALISQRINPLEFN